MILTDITLPAKSIHQFTRLAPWLLLLSTLFLLLAALSVVIFAWDFDRSYVMQEKRIPYLVVMYASLVILSLSSALRSMQAGRALLHLRKIQSNDVLTKAMTYTHESLMIFFTWLVFMVGLTIFVAFARAFY